MKLVAMASCECRFDLLTAGLSMALLNPESKRCCVEILAIAFAFAIVVKGVWYLVGSK